MEAKKPYLIAIISQLIYTGMFVITKAAFDHGMNTYVFILPPGCRIALPAADCTSPRKEKYAIIVARVTLKALLLCLNRVCMHSLISTFRMRLTRSTFSLNLYNVSLKFTSATVASATTNSMPVVTFCFALLLRMEVVRLRSSSGIAKLAGVSLCLAGVFVIAFYAGPSLSPINHHRAFAAAHAASTPSSAPNRVTWIKGTFLMVLSNMTWSLWIVMQAGLLKQYPNKMLVTVMQCVFSALQTFVVAVVAERDFSRWKLRLDVSLLAIIYTGIVVTGVSYYLQAWCVQIKGPVFFAAWTPLCFVFTMFCSSFFLGEIVPLGSVLWGKSKEAKIALCKEANTVDDVGCHKSQANEQTIPAATETEEV
ncbi:hypothetical protein EJB05_34485, partial [Eragrostis curvula]